MIGEQFWYCGVHRSLICVQVELVDVKSYSNRFAEVIDCHPIIIMDRGVQYRARRK